MAPPVTREAAAAMLGRFAVDGAIETLAAHGGGLINDSWLATLRAGAGRERFLLQRINRHVFRRPGEVMDNMVRVTRHLAARLERDRTADAGRRVLALVPARDGASHTKDASGETWRLLRWIEGTRSVERAANESEAHATALAFGRFLRLLQELPGPRLFETIPAFHDTEARLASFERTLAEDRVSRRAGCRPDVEALLDRRPLAGALAGPLRDGVLPERPVHNDAKIANVLFDEASGEALCVVDLDTVMPGLSAHDFGDLARTTVSDSDEDERDLDRVAVRRPFLAALAHGFVEGAGDALTDAERAHLVTGALVITYEQALRFLADHLDGDHYYRIARPGHNLERARAQLALLAALERATAEPAPA
jgi:aminoglycoside phosphotransferase (APT) family kinase protein